MLSDLVELFKTPAISALIAAITALVSAPLAQRLNKKASETAWLRDKSGQAYSDLITSLDRLVNAFLRLGANPTPENKEDFKTASQQFSHARSMIDLYGSISIRELLSQADFVSLQNVDAANWHHVSAMTLAEARRKIVLYARKDLGSRT